MLTTKEQSKSLGPLRFGKPKGFTFLVENMGPYFVEITKIMVSCGSCTTATVGKKRLEVGESTNINVTFTPGKLGLQTKHVNIEWNGSQILRLEFTAQVYE